MAKQMPPMKGKSSSKPKAKTSGLSQIQKAFEKSGMDDDTGVKEGSPADMKRDAKEMKAFKAKKGKK